MPEPIAAARTARRPPPTSWPRGGRPAAVAGSEVDRRGRRAVLTAALATGLLAGCGAPQQVIQSGTGGSNGQIGHVLLRNVYIENPPVTGYPAGSDVTVRLTLLNQADRPDALTGVTSDVAADAEIQADADCDGTAETVPSLALPAQLGLSSPPNRAGPNRAGYSVRLTDLRVGIVQGGSVPITFTFRRAGSITLPTPVDSIGGPQRSGTPPATPCRTAGGG
ncbi:MAG TPA: copper chaperone PCu(A)C [Mycobacteriales bacterium]